MKDILHDQFKESFEIHEADKKEQKLKEEKGATFIQSSYRKYKAKKDYKQKSIRMKCERVVDVFYEMLIHERDVKCAKIIQ